MIDWWLPCTIDKANCEQRCIDDLRKEDFRGHYTKGVDERLESQCLVLTQEASGLNNVENVG